MDADTEQLVALGFLDADGNPWPDDPPMENAHRVITFVAPGNSPPELRPWPTPWHYRTDAFDAFLDRMAAANRIEHLGGEDGNRAYCMK